MYEPVLKHSDGIGFWVRLYLLYRIETISVPLYDALLVSTL
jgi:hypothetical protein